MNTENQKMEPIHPEENNVEHEAKKLEFTDEIATHLDGAGKWGKFLAILGFVFMGLMVMGGIIVSIVFAFIPKSGIGYFPFPTFLIGIIYLVMAAIYLFPILYLYRFSTGIKMALMLKNQDQMVNAFRNLKALYRFIGIFTIVIFALYLLAIVIMLFAGLFTGFSGVTGMQV